MRMDVFIQPRLERLKLTMGELFFEVRYRITGGFEELRTVQAAQRVGREVTDR